MTKTEFWKIIKKGEPIEGGSEASLILRDYGFEARSITAELNSGFKTPEQVRELIAKLIGKTVDDALLLYPPFYTEFGKNISIGKNVFMNIGCTFQDLGGISIGDGSKLGQNVVIATLNHGFTKETRHILYPASVKIEQNVWIGSAVTITPGVTIKENAIVAAGSVVVKDVEPNTIVAGNPAKFIKRIS